jgi:hypothetical protein
MHHDLYRFLSIFPEDPAVPLAGRAARNFSFSALRCYADSRVFERWTTLRP